MELHPFFQEKLAFMEKLPFKYRPWLVSSLASLTGIALFISYFQLDPKASSYAQTENMFVKWEQSPEDQVSFQALREALHKIPALEKKYEPVIVQKLIEKGRGLEALEMARHSLKNIYQEAPFHAFFSETSLLIEEGIYQQALERSVSLKEKMATEWNIEAFAGEQLIGGSALYAHNLLRIACLQQALSNKPGELSAWEDLEAFLSLKENMAVKAVVFNNFQEKGLNLSHYIAQRKNSCK